MRLLIIDNDADFRRRFSGYIASGCSDVSITVGGEEAVCDTVMQGADHIICDEGISAQAFSAVIRSGIRCTVLRGSGELAGERHYMASYAGFNSGGANCGDHAFEVAAHDDIHENSRALKNDNIFKFQSAADIIRSIPELYEQAAVSGFLSDERRGTSVICVSGMTGGCGRTSFAIALARLIRQKTGGGVLVTGMAQMSDIYNYFTDTGAPGSADMNLLLLNYASGVRTEPSAYLINDEYGVSCVRPAADGVSDLSSMTADELAGFVDHIRSWNIFGTLIFDMDGRFDERSSCLYETADVIYALHDDRRCPFGAEDIWREWLAREAGGESDKRIYPVLNYDMSGGAVDRIFYDEGALRSEKIYAYCLPADPDSFFIKDGRADISMSGAYAAAVDGVRKGMAR